MFGRRSDSRDKLLVVRGDAQAATLAMVLKQIGPVTALYDVVHVGTGVEDPKMFGRCAVLLDQFSGPLSSSPKGLGLAARTVRFPTLSFSALWPLNTINPHNLPEPPYYPAGRFPYGDSFILSAIDAGTPSKTILALYRSDEWSASWPDLQNLLTAELGRLATWDRETGLKLGDFIAKRYRKERLFWAVHAPSNALFVELVEQVIAAALRGVPVAEAGEIRRIVSSFGSRDIFGLLSVPIHPLVARAFDLEWYTRTETFNYYDENELTYDEYFTNFIEHAAARAKRNVTTGEPIGAQ